MTREMDTLRGTLSTTQVRRAAGAVILVTSLQAKVKAQQD